MLVPRDAAFEAPVRASFARQAIMSTIGAQLVRVEPGMVHIGMDHDRSLTQQHGFLHAGIVATIADSACGYAAFSLMAADAGVLTVEYKVNLLRPAAGDRFVAEARVIRAGATLTTCGAEVYAESSGQRKHIASMMATIMAVFDKKGIEQ
jgi:uncharacterized protein (TIGR00369 family)